MKKIVFYTDSEMLGGAEIQMKILLENLPDIHKIVIMRDLTVFDHYFCELQKIPNLSLYKIKSKNKHSPSIFWQTFKILRSEKPNLIHLHTWNPMANKYGILAAKLLNLPIINTQHDPLILKFPKSIYQKWSLKVSEQIICVSQNNSDLLKRSFPKLNERISVIHNGVKTLENSPITADQRKKIYDELKISQKAFIVLSVGTLHPRKGFLDLINAFQRVLEVKPECHLIIAGEGPQKEILTAEIKRLNISEKVSIIGFRKDLQLLYQISDIFVLASHQEAFGLVIVEAMQAGKAIIATNSGGVPEILENGISGILIPPKNPQLLSEKILKLASNEDLKQKLEKNAIIRAHDFTDQKMALKYALQYQLILSRNEN